MTQSQTQQDAGSKSGTGGTDRWLLYDGDCPFCSDYVSRLRFERAEGRIRLVDARAGGPELETARQAGLDLDDGFVLRLDGRLYAGADAIHRLALVTTRSDAFNRLNAAVFRSPRRAGLVYPVLRTGRNLALRALGRAPIASGR